MFRAWGFRAQGSLRGGKLASLASETNVTPKVQLLLAIV